MMIGRAGVQNPEHHALAGLDANRLAMPQRVTVDGIPFIGDFQATFCIAHGGEVRIPAVERQEHFGIERAGLFFGINVQKSELARVRCAIQIPSRHGVSVIPARPDRLRRESISSHAVRWNHGRTFFHRPIDIRRDPQPMPMHQLRNGSLVVNLDGHRPAFGEAEQRSWNRSVVTSGLDDFPGRDFEARRPDAQRYVRFRFLRERRRGDQGQKVSTIHAFCNSARCAPVSFSTSACKLLPCASMVTMATKLLTRRCHIASGIPKSIRCTPSTRSIDRA